MVTVNASKVELEALAASKHVVCMVCGHADVYLGDHLLETHDLSEEEYAKRYPQAKVATPELLLFVESKSKGLRREPLTSLEGLTVNVPGLPVPLAVNHDVPEEACLPCPAHYRLPRAGGLGQDVQHFLIAWLQGRSPWVHGMPGCGKDAIVHWLSWTQRRPAILKSVRTGADLEHWFFSQGFSEKGTHWDEGSVLQALRDGYRTQTGRTIPYIVVFSDIDRADKAQAEILRMILDTTQKRVEGPRGRIYPVLPGTQIVLTSNTIGSGDSRGRCTSANVIDASLIDRAERVFEFRDMSWEDEEIICKNKWPLLAEKCPHIFPQVGRATEAARKAIRRREVAAEFSHRALEKWLGHAEDIVQVLGDVPTDLLSRSVCSYISSLPDEDTRERMMSILDSHIENGVVPEGGTDHIKKHKKLAGFS